MEPYERLRQARIQAGFPTAFAAIKANAWNQSTYNNHEAGRVPITIKRAQLYAAAFRTNVNWLLGNLDDIKADTQGALSKGKTLIELVRGSVQEPQSGLPLFGPRTFTERYEGRAMTLPDYPQLISGDILAFDPDKPPTQGDYVLAEMRKEQERVFRIYAPMGKGIFRLLALNPAFQPIKATPQSATILGTLVFVAREAFRLR